MVGNDDTRELSPGCEAFFRHEVKDNTTHRTNNAAKHFFIKHSSFRLLVDKAGSLRTNEEAAHSVRARTIEIRSQGVPGEAADIPGGEPVSVQAQAGTEPTRGCINSRRAEMRTV